MSLTNKYRPKDFNEIIGNEATLESIQKILTQKSIPHTYLFTGPQGCGKTTLARILVSNLKCNNIIEINTSDDRGIDSAREIIENMKFNSLQGGNKAFIMDEFHMTNNFYQNAVLKALEEPPDHVYFMLCTTNPEKLLKTVISRCTKFKVEPVHKRQLIRYLTILSEKENKSVNSDIIMNIVEVSKGHVRDAIKLLESIFDIEKDKALKIIKNFNLDENEQIINLCRTLLNGNWEQTKDILKNLNEDIEKIRWAILGYMSTVILSNDIDKNKRATLIIEYFKNSFYDSGKAGLYHACINIFY